MARTPTVPLSGGLEQFSTAPCVTNLGTAPATEDSSRQKPSGPESKEDESWTDMPRNGKCCGRACRMQGYLTQSDFPSKMQAQKAVPGVDRWLGPQTLLCAEGWGRL